MFPVEIQQYRDILSHLKQGFSSVSVMSFLEMELHNKFLLQFRRSKKFDIRWLKYSLSSFPSKHSVDFQYSRQLLKQFLYFFHHCLILIYVDNKNLKT